MIFEDPYGEIQMLIAGLPDSARTVVAKSKEFRAAEEVDLAFTLLERAVAKEPAPIILAEQADLLAAEGQIGRALDISLRAVDRDPTNGSTREVLCRVLVDGLPDALEYLVQISTLFAEEDELDFAEDLLRSAVGRYPEDVALRELLAQFYADHGRIAGCIVELRALLRLDPDHAKAHVMLASAMLQKGDRPGARRWLQKARSNGAPPQLVDDVERRLGELSASGDR